MTPKRQNTIRPFPEERRGFLYGGEKLPALIKLFEDANSNIEDYLYTMTVFIYYKGRCCDIRSGKCQKAVEMGDLLNNITSQRE